MRKNGFTLIELMVCVAIFGILSSVSIPLFKKYQVKARASEGKMLLSAIAKVEKIVYAEYGIYATCLSTMGYKTPPSYFFSHGFGLPNPFEALNISDNCALEGDPFFGGTKWIAPANSAPTTVQIGNAGLFTATGQTFQAVAVGNIGTTVSLSFAPSLFSSAYASNLSGGGGSKNNSSITIYFNGFTITESGVLNNYDGSYMLITGGGTDDPIQKN
jgi:prepilin-type N-terminal cleavage/methylation domain-containing protein